MRYALLFLALAGLSYGDNQWTGCTEGIRTAMDSLTWGGYDPSDYWGNTCTKSHTTTTLWASAKVYCSPKEIEEGYKLLNGYCVEYAGQPLVPFSELEPKLTRSFIDSLPRAFYSDIQDHTVFNTSVLISRPLFKVGRDTTVIFDYEYILHKRFGWGIFGFWGGILLIGVIKRLVSHFLDTRRMKGLADVEDNTATPKRKPSSLSAAVSSAHNWVKANLIIPAAYGKHHSRPLYWSTIPTRIETIIVTAFYAMVFILCCCGYYIIPINLYYTRAEQFWRYISDRTGILSYACLSWIWLFSGRNNVFLWLTGWNFSTFNIFHRHVARMATLLAIIHSIGWTVMEGSYLASDWKQQYWYMGAIATIAMSFLVLFSFMWFRVRSYEFFLLFHIVFSVFTLVGLFYHTHVFTSHEYDPYLWPPVALWIIDRGARVVRWGYCNLHISLGHSLIATRTTATYDKEANVIRLDIVPGSRLLKPGPGQHYFLYQPFKLRGWENHPFTLGSYERFEDPDTLENTERNRHANTIAEKDGQVVTAGPSTPTSLDSASDSSQHKTVAHKEASGQQKLVFLLRPFGSWTRRLQKECLKSPTGVITPTIFLEGPYGERSPLHTFETVLFIVGGTGISGALPYIIEHMERTDNNARDGPDGKHGTRTRDITLLWTTKQSAMIRNVASHELRQMLKRRDIHIYLHATSPKEQSLDHPGAPVVSDSKELKRIHTASTAEELNIAYCRPDITATVSSVVDDVHNAGPAGGRVAILTCGPAGMADEARAAVHAAMKQGKREVDYIEETFGW